LGEVESTRGPRLTTSIGNGGNEAEVAEVEVKRASVVSVHEDPS
jgi:hypothetical protein